MSNYHKIVTKIGNIWAKPMQKDYIYVCLGENLNAEEEGPGPLDRRDPIKVRGISYYGSAYVHLWSDGTFHVGQEEKPEWEHKYHSLWLGRPDRFCTNSEAASESARIAIIAAITPVLNQWVKDNPFYMNEAHQEHLENERDRRNRKISELRDQIVALQEEIAELS
jgi:hypothetical protein